jgi:hypothetical protein
MWWLSLLVAIGAPLLLAAIVSRRLSQTALPSDRAPGSRYFLTDPAASVEGHKIVPLRAIYAEKWTRGHTTLCVVRHEGEPIPTTWTETPWDRHAQTPWIWVGDRESESDWTGILRRYLVVGNRITPSLIEALGTGSLPSLMYIEAGTFVERSFPTEGLTIEEYVDRALCDRGSVHHDEAPVHAPVVGEHVSSSE